MDEDEDQRSDESFDGGDVETQLAEARKRIKDLNAENKERRESLEAMQVTHLTEIYGEDRLKENAELLDGLSFTKQKALLARLVPNGSAATTEPETGTAPEAKAQEEPEAPGLAAVSSGSAPTTATAGELLTVAQIQELAKTDPLEASKLINEGRFQPAAPL